MAGETNRFGGVRITGSKCLNGVHVVWNTVVFDRLKVVLFLSRAQINFAGFYGLSRTRTGILCDTTCASCYLALQFVCIKCSAGGAHKSPKLFPKSLGLQFKGCNGVVVVYAQLSKAMPMSAREKQIHDGGVVWFRQ